MNEDFVIDSVEAMKAKAREDFDTLMDRAEAGLPLAEFRTKCIDMVTAIVFHLEAARSEKERRKEKACSGSTRGRSSSASASSGGSSRRSSRGLSKKQLDRLQAWSTRHES